MARLESTAKGGYYPFPTEHLAAVAALIAPASYLPGESQPSRHLLDACAGEGAALEFLAEAWKVQPYANELDHERAAHCRERFGAEHALQGDLFHLHATLEAFDIIWCNPPYAQDSAYRRVELAALKHCWKWLAPAGLMLWAIYNQHMTREAAEFWVANAGDITIFRVPGLHLGQHAQIVVAGRKTARREPEMERVAELVMAGEQPDQLPILEKGEKPRYRLLPRPADRRLITFRPATLGPEKLLEAISSNGAQQLAAFQRAISPPPPPADFRPIVQPRAGQLGLVLAGGLLDGAQIRSADGNRLALRGVVRHVEVDVTPEEERETRETFQTRPVVTVTLLSEQGEIQTLVGEAALVALLKEHRATLLAHIDRHSQPLYNFSPDPSLEPVLNSAFAGRRLPGRPQGGLFAVQKHVVAALYEALKTRKGVIACGEMGVGKSAIGAALAAALHARMKPGQVALIMAPPHLVRKWQSEASDAAPGCFTAIAEKVEDVTALMARAAANPGQLHFLIASRERMKLHEGWQAAYSLRRRRETRWSYDAPVPEGLTKIERIRMEEDLLCPTCGEPVMMAERGFSVPATPGWLEQQPRHCKACGGALWQMKRSFSAPEAGQKYPKRNPRYALADFIRQRYPQRVGVFLCDEYHEEKSGSSDQGLAMQTLAHVADKVVGLTGTIFGGVASSLFWLEWVMNPRMVRNYPISISRAGAIAGWVRDMGVLERVVEYKEDNSQAGRTNGTRRVEHKPREVPGISPQLVSELLDHVVWVSLADLGFALPAYEETPVELALEGTVETEYRQASRTLKEYLVKCTLEGDNSFLGAYLQALLSYPSACFRDDLVYHRRRDKAASGGPGEVSEQLVLKIQGGGDETVYPKEQWLLDTLRQELAKGRRCAVFVRQSGTRDIQPRLMALIQTLLEARPAILPGSVPAKDRDARLGRWVKEGVNVLICNPELIKTGLDLLAFPTLIHYEISYSLYTVAQASRRAWRIGQTRPCKVYFPYYRGTMEAQAIALVSRKQEAAGLLSGNVEGSGLAALSAGSGGGASLVSELAKIVAEDEQVVDLGQLFKRKAQESADFTSGWAEAFAAGEMPADAPISLHSPQPNQAEQLSTTAALRQRYLEVKQGYPDAILFFRIGDFYECFEADAELVARELDVVLTSRAIAEGKRVPMAGVPQHAAEGYIRQLVEKGHRVLLCEDLAGQATTREWKPGGVTITKKKLDVEAIAGAAHTLPATLTGAYARFRVARKPGMLTFVEMNDAFLSFEADALEASRRLFKPASRRVLPGKGTLDVLSLPRGSHEAAFTRLRKGNCGLLLAGAADVTLPALPAAVAAQPHPEGGLPDTPWLAAYRQAKAAYPQHIIFEQRDGLFTTYHDDARLLAAKLNLPLRPVTVNDMRLDHVIIPASQREQVRARLAEAGLQAMVLPAVVTRPASPPHVAETKQLTLGQLRQMAARKSPVKATAQPQTGSVQPALFEAA